MDAGTAYVYNIYGQYCCLNISSKDSGGGVLIRALEPVYGTEMMNNNRFKKRGSSNPNNTKNITNGPSKLCQALQITKILFNQINLNYQTNSLLWLQNDFTLNEKELVKFQIVKTKRVGLNANVIGNEACNYLYRFFIKDNPFVSVKSKFYEEYETDYCEDFFNLDTVISCS